MSHDKEQFKAHSQDFLAIRLVFHNSTFLFIVLKLVFICFNIIIC